VAANFDLAGCTITVIVRKMLTGERQSKDLSYCDMISRQYKHRLRSCKGRFSRSDYVTEEMLKDSVSETTISGVSKPRGFPNIDAGSRGVRILGGITPSVFFEYLGEWGKCNTLR
jgi:hypothetical protein